MKREDYERKGPPGNVQERYELVIREGRVTTVCAAAIDEEPTGPTHASMLIEVKHEESRVAVLMDKERCDDLITKLIACRNHLWPTP